MIEEQRYNGWWKDDGREGDLRREGRDLEESSMHIVIRG